MPQQPSPFFSTVLNPETTSSPSPYQTTPARAPFTAHQRSQQARGHSYTAPYADAEAESYESRQRRNHAAEVLENVEMLIWYSGARNESMSATRQHFMNIVMGIEESPQDVVWREEYEVPIEERVKGREGTRSVEGSPRSGKGREKDKGKKRA